MLVSSLKIILPVGISFFTFTALSYSIDVYQWKSVILHGDGSRFVFFSYEDFLWEDDWMSPMMKK